MNEIVRIAILAGLLLLIVVVIAVARTPEFPDDDGERM